MNRDNSSRPQLFSLALRCDFGRWVGLRPRIKIGGSSLLVEALHPIELIVVVNPGILHTDDAPSHLTGRWLFALARG